MALAGKPSIINKYTNVVQEYFQERVKAWLETVGRNLLGIKHHWLRYEFAPSRGQVHAHMLVICENKEVLKMCSALKHDKVRLADYLSSWLSDTVGMTAELDKTWCDGNDTNMKHPSTVRFSSLDSNDRDRDLTQCQLNFQKHKCSEYCMRKRYAQNSGESDNRRFCRCGAGKEKHLGMCDTPGFFQIDKPAIVRDHRGFDRVDLKRNNSNVVQASSFLCQGWRGNCDIQYLLYLSDTDDIDASEICRVTNYIVSYSCKGSETEVEEKNGLKHIISAAQEEYGDSRDVKKVARRMLNECSKSRVISKQEATCHLLGLNLYSCSEKVEIVSLSGEHRLGTDSQSSRSLLVRYAKRPDFLKCMNLYDFFDYSHNKPDDMKRKNWKRRIPMFQGGRCEAVYPATTAYARAVLLVFQPWTDKFSIDKDSPLLLKRFNNFIKDRHKCPKVVRVAYERARLMKHRKEPTTSTADIAYVTAAAGADEETRALVDLVGTIFTANEDPDEGLSNLDYGKQYNWSEPCVKVSSSRSDTVLINTVIFWLVKPKNKKWILRFYQSLRF